MWLRRPDPVQEIGAVAAARREVLLRAHAFRLRREDLEDAYSQATLELMLRARRGGTFASRRHIANALEQRFLSRIHDRLRALSGRSPIQAALEDARSLGPGGGRPEIADTRAELEQIVLLRAELRRITEAASQPRWGYRCREPNSVRSLAGRWRSTGRSPSVGERGCGA
jgi:hypothetical protein